MSHQWPGGLIRKTPPTPTGPYENSAAPGVWTLEQQAYYLKQGLWPTAGNVNPDAFIENLFQTWLYVGNSSTQTITNGIDLSTKGGLVWIKSRAGSYNHQLVDTTRGSNKYLNSNTTDAEATATNRLTAFNTNGFALGAASVVNEAPATGYAATYASWTFREQPKFFDVVTYTGDGNYSTDTPAPYGRAISHALGSTPGFIVIKATSTTSEWYVGARRDDTFWIGSAGAGGSAFALNRTNSGSLTNWATSPMGNATSFFPAQIGAGGSSGTTNDNGVTYVAYLFAHNAGGFGLTGTDNVISCGSFTTDSGGVASVTLGYEPQWVMTKNSSGTSAWRMFDTMRGMTTAGQNDALLQANSSAAEITNSDYCSPTATGFEIAGHEGSATFIYIAIRRGPMKTPTTGTSVFQPTTWTGTGAALQQNVNINYDSFMQWRRNGGYSTPWMDRLRGFGYSLYTQQITAEVNQTAFIAGTLRNNFVNFVDGTYNLNGEPWLNYAFVRAPGFFDVVCYTGNGANRTLSHNLGAVPEMMIVKARTGFESWITYHSSLGNTRAVTLNNDQTPITSSLFWNNTTPTSSVFTVSTADGVNSSSYTFVAYLFASCPGVSKVGSYTGTGALQTVNCGFTGGARFVLIKRTDSTGDWWVYDSARGISSGNDPYLFMNSTAAEVTGTNYVDTTSVGFQVTAAAPAGLNANGGTFVFLAIS